MGKNQISDMNKAKNNNFNILLSGCLNTGVLPGIEIARLTGIKVAQLVSDSLNERPYFKLVVVPATAETALASAQSLLAQVNQTKFADDPRLSMLTSLVEGLGKHCTSETPAEVSEVSAEVPVECAEATAETPTDTETVSEPQDGPVEAFAGDSLTSDTPEIQMALTELPEPLAEVPMIEAVPEVLATPAPVKAKSAPKKKADAKKASPAKSASAKQAKPAKKTPEFVTA